uniref:Uncharacterized protein n=1 Tax=Bionectria ochroleuca TaxID=29856 RepID=A0A8H7MYU2_BIOOC
MDIAEGHTEILAVFDTWTERLKHPFPSLPGWEMGVLKYYAGFTNRIHSKAQKLAYTLREPIGVYG